MSEMSKVVSDRDRARLQFKEYVMELAAARGQEDDMIDKLIIKVNEAFDMLLSSHVELVLSLGESFSDESHENFMYEASDERDEAVEEAEEEKVKAKKIIKEKTIKESIKVDNPGLLGKKDREEFFDKKLEISRKVSQEVAEGELFRMFSAWANSQVARPVASFQDREVPQEISRALNRSKSVGQKLQSIPEEIFDGGLEASETEVLYGAPGQVSCAGSYDVTAEPTNQEPEIWVEETFGGEAPKAPDIAVKIHREVEATVTDELHDPGEKLFDSVAQSKDLTRFNITLNDRDPTRFKLMSPVCVKRRSGSIRLNNKSAMAGQLGYDNGKFAQNESIRIMGEGAVMHTPSSIELYDPVGGAPVGEEYVFSKSARASQFVYDNGKLAKYGVWGTKHLTQQESVSFKLEQQFGDLQQARDLAKLKLLGTINAERSAGSIVLVTKCGFDKKGVGDSNLLEQYNYIVRSYEDTGPLIKYNRFKVSGAVCLEEKHRAFNREEFNILLKHTIDKLKFSGTAYAKIFIGGFGLFAKPVHTSKVGRLKDIDPRFQRRLKDIYLRIQKEEGDRA